ncbi:hypothetical protein BIW11_04206 [Tropilaelaps mercedesae]|uniref:Uncharacterized protein n=1 Tax=Tropilaelaps mercedesae TaxID=418985 RepID=A0A1V9X9H7_9ACAR|nr:hypothetical protein BIW11_04206 [Tropilaelaps mercedesae]
MSVEVSRRARSCQQFARVVLPATVPHILAGGSACKNRGKATPKGYILSSKALEVPSIQLEFPANRNDHNHESVNSLRTSLTHRTHPNRPAIGEQHAYAMRVVKLQRKTRTPPVQKRNADPDGCYKNTGKRLRQNARLDAFNWYSSIISERETRPLTVNVVTPFRYD